MMTIGPEIRAMPALGDKGIAAPEKICTGEYEAGCRELGIIQ